MPTHAEMVDLSKEKIKIMLVAGEASGDAHAAKLVKALKELAPETDFEFFGASGEKSTPERGWEDRYQIRSFINCRSSGDRSRTAAVLESFSKIKTRGGKAQTRCRRFN